MGELIVKGNGVMKGYYRNPDLTAKTIRNHWLWAGDLAKVDDEGFIENGYDRYCDRLGQ